MTNETPMTCAEFEALIPDLMDGTLTPRQRELMDAHRLDCAECNAIVVDLLDIRQQASKLEDLSPSRDLWAGIESRIQTEVVQFPRTPVPGEVKAVVVASGEPIEATATVVPARRPRVWRLAVAASLLVAATAGITWSIASRSTAVPSLATDSLAAGPSPASLIVPVRGVPMEVSYDKEIADLRRIVDDHRAELDSATVAVLERSLKVIDDAIAESKAALAASPESVFLAERLNDAYATKLRTLRAVVTPRRG